MQRPQSKIVFFQREYWQSFAQICNGNAANLLLSFSIPSFPVASAVLFLFLCLINHFEMDVGVIRINVFIDFCVIN